MNKKGNVWAIIGVLIAAVMLIITLKVYWEDIFPPPEQVPNIEVNVVAIKQLETPPEKMMFLKRFNQLVALQKKDKCLYWVTKNHSGLPNEPYEGAIFEENFSGMFGQYENYKYLYWAGFFNHEKYSLKDIIMRYGFINEHGGLTHTTLEIDKLIPENPQIFKYYSLKRLDDVTAFINGKEIKNINYKEEAGVIPCDRVDMILDCENGRPPINLTTSMVRINPESESLSNKHPPYTLNDLCANYDGFVKSGVIGASYA